MKYCTKCGTQLMDESVICTKCGCMVEGAPVRASKPDSNGSLNAALKQPSPLLLIFNFLFALAAILTIVWFSASIVNARVMIISSKPHFWLMEDAIIVTLIGSLITAVVGVVSFVLTLVERLDRERLFGAIIKLCTGLVMVGVAITALNV